MMGSEREKPVDVDDTVFVAVGKDIKECESTVLWAANSISGKKICLLYVHQPLRFSFFDGKFLSSKLKQRSFKAFHELEVQKIHKLLNQYVLLLAEAKVQVDKAWIEMDSVEEGIIKFIVEHGVRWLVMGAAADKHHTSDLAELTSKKAIFVCERAPPFCQIWFVCMGCQIYMRESKKDDLFEGSSPEWLHLSSISSEDAQTEGWESARLDYLASDHESLPGLTPRELGSLLRAHSLDLSFSFQNYKSLTSPSSTKSLPSPSNVRTDGHESAFSLSVARMISLFHAGRTRLTTVREIMGRVEQAISGSDKLKQFVFEKSMQRWRAEEDAMEAKHKAEYAEMLYSKESRQIKEMEEALEKQKHEIERIKYNCERCTKDLLVVCHQSSVLKDQITESEYTTKELEKKIVSAVDLLISFREKRDQLRVEHKQAIAEMRTLKKWKAELSASLCGPQFPNFSFLEINEATFSFDPSKRIGSGRYASVYEGILRHMKVAIKMLPNDSSLDQLNFEQQVEVLSRVRHPNLVTLLGISSESRSIIYEYIEKGCLEDHLNFRNRKPLSWQTRVRIAAELCSVIIFLKSNNPPIIHGNLKPSKILLDSNLVSKICDLGISHLIPQNQMPTYSDCNQNYSSIYIDPEFLGTGKLTPESDVYSFGVILLRLLTGRPTVGLVKDVRCALRNDNIENILDSSAGRWPVYQAKRLAGLAIRCCESNQVDQPDLASDVWSVLDELMRNSANASGSCLGSKEKPRVPPHFICPIFKEVMKDPLIAADGFTYEGEAIREWLGSGHQTSPMTNLKLPNDDLFPNHALYYTIQDFLKRSS